MGAAIARMEQGSRIDAGTDRRRQTRKQLSEAIYVRQGAGDRFAAKLSDLSILGCNIRFDAAALRVGGFVDIQIGDTAPLQAIVRWSDGESAGLEFMRSIPADRLEWQKLIASPQTF